MPFTLSVSRVLRLSLALVLACAGCMMPQRGLQETLSLTSPPYTSAYNTPAPAPAPVPSVAATPAPNAAAHALATTSASPTELATVMAEVQQIGAQDPEAQQALLEQLKRTDPSLWPQLVSVFRSSLAYHQQSTVRLAQSAPQIPLAASYPALPPSGAVQSGPPSLMRQVGYSDQAQKAAASTPGQTEQTLAQSLSEATGPLMPRAQPTGLVTTYPDTMLPAVKLASASNSRAISGDKISGDPIADFATQSGGDWHEPLTTAIRALESQSTSSPDHHSATADQARLRLLYLAAGRRDDAAAISSAPVEQQEFWSQELTGLAALMDESHASDSQHRADEAARHLHAAASELEQNAPLALHHLAFCTEVSSFGVYKAFPKFEFKAGQEALLYAEVENFTSTTTDQGYHTALHSNVQILDRRGDRVATQDFAVTEENCRNLRRDFFVRYFLNIPKNLAAGEYTLQLTVEDTQGNKSAQANIPFSVIGG